jgi:hypothetical protein
LTGEDTIAGKMGVPLERKINSPENSTGKPLGIVDLLGKAFVGNFSMYKKYSMYCPRCKKYYPGVWKECRECKHKLISSRLPLLGNAIKGLVIFALILYSTFLVVKYVFDFQNLGGFTTIEDSTTQVYPEAIEKKPAEDIYQKKVSYKIAPKQLPTVSNIIFGKMAPDGSILEESQKLILPKEAEGRVLFGYFFDYNVGAAGEQLTTVLHLPGNPDKDLGPNFDSETNTITVTTELPHDQRRYGHRWYLSYDDLPGEYKFGFHIGEKSVGGIDFEVIDIVRTTFKQEETTSALHFPDKESEITYELAYHAGYEGALEDKEGSYPYDPQAYYNLPIFQMSILAVKQSARGVLADERRFDKYFKKGFFEGYKDGYYGHPKRRSKHGSW